jgi:ribokinase
MAPRLLCLGNLTFDDVVLPDGTERPRCTGGDALYAALAARAVLAETEFVAPVGNDFPAAVAARIAAAGLSREGMPVRPRPTLHNRVVYDAGGGRSWTLFDDEAGFDALSPRLPDIPPAFRAAGHVLILAMTLAAQEDLVRDLRRLGRARIALDTQEDYVAGNEARLAALVGQCDIALPSAVEVSRWLGHERWDDAAREIAALGPSLVVVKLGADGALVHDRRTGATTTVPATPATVVDTTGAGDAYCGAFLAALVRGEAPVEAARWASAAASFAVEAFGMDGLWTLTPAALRARLATGASAPRS